MQKLANIFIITTSLLCNGQITVPLTYDNFNNSENGNYLKDTNGHLDKFIGTWKYTDGNEELTLNIIKSEHIEYTMYSVDELCGGYKYVKNGIVKANRLDVQYKNLSDPLNLGYFSGGNLSPNYQKVILAGSDIVGKREIYIDLEIIANTNPVHMRWKMQNRENFVINNKGFKQGTGTGIPNDIILIKQ